MSENEKRVAEIERNLGEYDQLGCGDSFYLLSEIDRLEKENKEWQDARDQRLARVARLEEDFRVMREIAVENLKFEDNMFGVSSSEYEKEIDQEFKKRRGISKC